MKLFLIVFLGILALNALVILAITGILMVDYWKSRRKESDHDAPANAS